ncbi:Kunitz/Bovine pancreatic trypsin inhibitor domain protein [Teladorsagia circumcincta]|uniref:Kunitz/Bovine pancreatic trypsin inhibitor domain protein n=1 Tax=Teladorsagia circumcincta TaxID=45464 RepID=A0A2G9T5C9_TELCI|nr:Kunitz/Bovine pancreatic trypsin inhibitor domain protein [Teladorsagia circumcincta]
MLSCRQFVYYGCDGNMNNFPDAPTCEAACGAKLTSTAAYHRNNDLRCPNPYVDPLNWPQMCGSEKDIPCNGACISLGNGFRVCCTRLPSPSPSSSFELCGHGLTPVVRLPTGEPLQCTSEDDCDGGTCRFNSAIMTRTCCTNGE